MDLRNKTTSEFRTDLHSPLSVPNSQVSLYIVTFLRMFYFTNWEILLGSVPEFNRMRLGTQRHLLQWALS